MKSREEIETSIGDGDDAAPGLRALGFTPRFRYQKYREERPLGGLIVAIDETPIGVFVELEGQEAEIAAVAGRLGRARTTTSAPRIARCSWSIARRAAATAGHDLHRPRDPRPPVASPHVLLLTAGIGSACTR